MGCMGLPLTDTLEAPIHKESIVILNIINLFTVHSPLLKSLCIKRCWMGMGWRCGGLVIDSPDSAV